MVVTEVGKRHFVANRTRGRTEALLQNLHGIGSGDSAHRIDHDAEAGADQAADRAEVKQAFHQVSVVFHRIDDFDNHVTQRIKADRIKIDIRFVEDLVGIDDLGAGKDRIGDFFRCGTTIADIVLDTEVFRRAAGLWLADSTMPPKAPYLRMTCDAAGVERMPPLPTMTLPKPLAAAIFRAF